MISIGVSKIRVPKVERSGPLWSVNFRKKIKVIHFVPRVPPLPSLYTRDYFESNFLRLDRVELRERWGRVKVHSFYSYFSLFLNGLEEYSPNESQRQVPSFYTSL